MLDQLRRVIFRWNLDPKRAIAVTTYGTVENIVALEDMGIWAYVPLPDFDEHTAYWGASHFTYDADHDQYQCPQKEVLTRRRTKYTEGKIEYRADADACTACPMKQRVQEVTMAEASIVPSTRTTSSGCVGITRRPHSRGL
jgi:hypothetical protein